MTANQADRPATGWKKKLLLDAAVAVAVWAAGLAAFRVAGEWSSRSLLLLVPLLPVTGFWLDDCFSGGPLGKWLWDVALLLLPVVFAGQFAGRRGRGWTVAGAVAVALWFAAGILVALALAGAAHC